jgi:phosphoribosylanthranilate isomerase
VSAVRRPLVKICGVTRVEDAAAAAELGADFIGLNFWPGSPRYIDARRGAEISSAVDGTVGVVGVFVNASMEEVLDRIAEARLDIVQLHGDESPDCLGKLTVPAWRAFRGVPSMEVFRLWAAAAGVLVDSRREGAFGGSGESWDYAALRGMPRDGRPLLVSGGIRPAKARQALVASGADGVDVASGVESSPGIKDREKMRRLIGEVRGEGT